MARSQRRIIAGRTGTVAYRPVKVGGGINVYYSTIFTPFKNQVEKLKSENSAMAELFRTNYEVWIGYHASLQENGRLDQKEVDNEILEKLLETDGMRVARMQVRQAMRTADLTNQIMKAKSVAE